MEFVSRVEISINFSKQKHILYRYNSHDKIVLRIDYMYHKSSAECLVTGFAHS